MWITTAKITVQREKKQRLSDLCSYNDTSLIPKIPGKLGNVDVDFKTGSNSSLPVIDTNVKSDGCLRFRLKVRTHSLIERSISCQCQQIFAICSCRILNGGASRRNAWRFNICCYFSNNSIKILIPPQILIPWNSELAKSIRASYLQDNVMIDIKRQVVAFESLNK